MLFTKPYQFEKAKRSIKNRIALAPMTNKQSHADGRASEDEMAWLEARAVGGFAMLITCAAHVSLDGQGWEGEMGIFDDRLLPGLQELSERVQQHDSQVLVQLYHGGLRSPKRLTGATPLAPTAYPPDDRKVDGCREMSLSEIQTTCEAFVKAAVRAHQAGFDGVELHAAHGYLLHQFLDPGFNRREDGYGGDLQGRSRLLIDIVRGIRAALPRDFILAVRLSPSSFQAAQEVNVVETMELAQQLAAYDVDMLHYSLWDFRKTADEPELEGRRLMDLILERHPQRAEAPIASMVAGGFRSVEDVEEAIAQGADFVALGRLAIANPDWPLRASTEPGYTAKEPPYTRQQLRDAKLGEAFIDYMARWPNFLVDSKVNS